MKDLRDHIQDAVAAVILLALAAGVCYGLYGLYLLFSSYGDSLAEQDSPAPTVQAAPPPVQYPPNITDQQRRIINDALDVLTTVCTGLIRWRSDLALLDIEIMKTPDDEFSRPVFLRFEFLVSEHPQVMPNSGRYLGHHLYYDIGGGDKPGFYAAKRVSQQICDGYTGSDWPPEWPGDFKPVPELKFVDELAASK